MTLLAEPEGTKIPFVAQYHCTQVPFPTHERVFLAKTHFDNARAASAERRAPWPSASTGYTRGTKAVQLAGTMRTSPSSRSTHTTSSPGPRTIDTNSPHHGCTVSVMVVVGKPVFLRVLAVCLELPESLDERN